MIENILLMAFVMAVGGGIFIALLMGFAYYLEAMDE